MQPDNTIPTTQSQPIQPVQAIPTVQLATPAVTTTTQPQGQYVYAGIWTRFCAVFIDGIIITIASTILRLPTVFMSSAAGQGNMVIVIVGLILSLISLAISIGYPIYFIGSKGQTPGKMVMKIKVIKLDGSIPGYMSAFLREIVGKFLSSILALGYITAFGDPQKRTWHDKIAGTIVVKV